MLRLITSSALAAFIFAGMPASAGTGPHMQHAASHHISHHHAASRHAMADTHHAHRVAEACRVAADQWNDARYDAHGNTHLNAAKALAAKARQQCASPRLSVRLRGEHNYRAAIRLLGVTPI